MHKPDARTGEITSPASSSDVPRMLDAIQEEVGEGPCLDAMSAGRREEDLERKAQSRDVIGRAKGVLMAREGLTDELAFDVLRRASQRLNIKLSRVAEDIADDTGAEHLRNEASN